MAWHLTTIKVSDVQAEDYRCEDLSSSNSQLLVAVTVTYTQCVRARGRAKTAWPRADSDHASSTWRLAASTRHGVSKPHKGQWEQHSLPVAMSRRKRCSVVLAPETDCKVQHTAQ